MRVLVLAEKHETAKPFVNAMAAKGIKATYLQLVKISLISKHKNTLIKAMDEDIPQYDAVFLQARSNLAPFLEPLIEALNDKKIYCNAKPGAFYLAVNEPYQFVNLAVNNVPIPKTLCSGSKKNIERVSKKISYPLLAKSFKGKDVQQSTIVRSYSELNNFVNSIRTKIDGFMLREFIGAGVISCVVIGEKVFAIDRMIEGKGVNLERGKSCTLTDTQKEIVINAAKASKLDIAKIDIIKNQVISVETQIPLDIFNDVCSVKIENNIASFFEDKINEVGAKRQVGDDIKELATKLKKTIFGGLLK